MNVTAVINQKGGVGKTTASINLASGLALNGQKVLLIDLDPQSHSTLGLGIDPNTYNHAMHDVLLNSTNIKDIILSTQIKNLFIAPSHIRLDRAEQQLAQEMFREGFLAKAIKKLKYDFIIIDCRPTLGTLTINALYACNFVLVPCEMGRYSLDGFAGLMETIGNVKRNDNFNFGKHIRILLTKYESRNKITNEWVLDQLEPFKNLLFKTRIRKNEALNQAHIAEEPIFIFKSNSAGAEDYKQLTKEFLKLCRT